MSLRSRLRVVLLCMALQIGVLSGVPMRPDEIQELMHQLNQPKMAHALRSENDEGEDPPGSLSED